MHDYEVLNLCFEKLGSGAEGSEILKILREGYCQDSCRKQEIDEINSYEKLIHYLVSQFSSHLERGSTTEEDDREIEIKKQNKQQEDQYEIDLRSARKKWDAEYKLYNKINPSNTMFVYSKQYNDFLAAKKAEFDADYNLQEKIIPYESPLEIIKRKFIALRRQALLDFIKHADPDIFATRDKRGRSILYVMLGSAMAFGEEVICRVIEKTPDIKEHHYVDPKSPGVSSFSEQDENSESESAPTISLLEIIIKDKIFIDYSKGVENIAKMLLKRGCEIEIVKDGIVDEALLNGMLSPRFCESGLAQLLCSYFLIEKKDATIFSCLLQVQEGRGAVTRGGSNYSSIKVDDGWKKGVFNALKDALDLSISGAINEAVDNVGESIPSLILRCKIAVQESGERSTAAKLWEYFQAKERIEKLDERLFLINSPTHGAFLHQVAKSKNATLLEFCLQKINGFGDKAESILEALNENGRTPLHIACAFGFDAGIKGLFSHEIANEVDKFGATPLIIAIEQGMKNSCDILLSLGVDPESNKSPLRPLYVAARGNKEGVVKILLEKYRVDPNRKSIVSIDGIEREVDALQEAIEQRNNDSVAILVRFGAKTKDEQGQYLEHYRAYKEDLSDDARHNLDEQEELAEQDLRIKQGHLNSKFKDLVGQLLSQKQVAIAGDVRRKMMAHCRSGEFFAAFNDYNEFLNPKVPALTPSSSPIASGGVRAAAESEIDGDTVGQNWHGY